MIFLFTEIYIDTAEIGPMKVSLRFTVDIIMQVFFSRQFHHCVLPCPGGCPGQGGDGSKTPPVPRIDQRKRRRQSQKELRRKWQRKNRKRRRNQEENSEPQVASSQLLLSSRAPAQNR